MATAPIYITMPNLSSDGTSTATSVMALTLTTAAADYTGISANNRLVFTANATNGGYVQRLRFKALGTNGVSVARIYINNGGVNTSAANNSFYGEIALPATTAIATTSTIDLDYPLNFGLDTGFRIFVGLGTTVVAGWVVTPIGGKY